ncbi:disfunctional anti-sigma-K factor [Mycobacterium tuberculosis]|nr:disfunctional anti-sigma-K factor [Mycobacterium tuberculosis]
MTEHTDFELLELATPYALNAVSDDNEPTSTDGWPPRPRR